MRSSHKRNRRSSAKADLDQVDRTLRDPYLRTKALEPRPIDVDLPGLGQHYCVQCAVHYASAADLTSHRRGSKHRRRVKLLKEVPYTHEEASLAGGITPGRPLLKPLPPQEVLLGIPEAEAVAHLSARHRNTKADRARSAGGEADTEMT
ncbi:hypothetical protein PYCC9005_003477 [Savitreella phatthalungensis]